VSGSVEFSVDSDLNLSKICDIGRTLAEKATDEPEFWRKSEHVIHPLQFKSNQESESARNAEIAQYLFYITAINFSYWQTPSKNSENIVGIQSVFTVNGWKTTWAMVASVKRALENGLNVLDAKFHLAASNETLKGIFKPDDGCPSIPLIEKRIDNWKEISTVLIEKFNGSIYEVLKLADKSAVKFLNILLENFPCFRDESEIDGEIYGFYKRAQLLVADIWNHCDGTGLTNFYDIDELTAFADYRVPQSLKALGCLKYSESLTKKIENFVLIEQHIDEEIEIRAGTIKACEKIAKFANEILGHNLINSTIVDNYLWVYAKFKVKEKDLENYHLTRCSNY